MSDIREEEALGKIYDSRLTHRLIQYLRPYKWWVFLALALALAVAPLEIVGPYFFKIAVDNYITPVVQHRLAFATAMRFLGWISIGFLVALGASFGLQYLQMRVMQRVGQEIMYDLRREIFTHLQRLPLGFFDRSPIGRLVTRVTTDVDALNDLFASGVVAMLNDFFVLFCLVVVLFHFDTKLALATLSPLPLMLLTTLIFRTQVRDANRRIRTAIARINSFLQEHITGMSIVQLFNRERKSKAEFERLNRIHMDAYKDAINAFAYFYPTVEFLSIAAIALVFWFGGLRVIAGGLEAGLLIAFMMWAQRFFRPIQDLSDKFNILQTAMAASERIFKLLDEPLTVETVEHRAQITAAQGDIEFRHVWFSYRGTSQPGHESKDHELKDEDWVLRDVSFHIAPGQTLAIVGHTGAGKTTLIQLLLRFYEIQRGQILLDGVDIRALDVHDLRRQFGIVLQDPFLFTGTIESNVRLGSESVDALMVSSALDQIGLGDFVRSLPGGIGAEVTERGATLSVGQRQLLSFARALAHNPRFLILDEATSSVDTMTEQIIRLALDKLLQGRTALVIAHRLSTIQHADRILVFHKGRLREEGSHQELLARRGIYYRLYQLQYKEQELGEHISRSELVGASGTVPAEE
jgi:ATP-binding cassette, subfamily B, multidrug efflux pump